MKKIFMFIFFLTVGCFELPLPGFPYCGPGTGITYYSRPLNSIEKPLSKTYVYTVSNTQCYIGFRKKLKYFNTVCLKLTGKIYSP